MNKNHLLTVQEVKSGNPLLGEVEETWTTLRQLWCSIEPLTGREYALAKQTQSAVTHNITSEFMAGANSGMRLVKLSPTGDVLREFGIESVVNVKEENRELLWRAIEAT